MKFLPLLGFICLLTISCVSLWPWSYSTAVNETEEVVNRRQLNRNPKDIGWKPPPRFRVRAVSAYEKQFDRDGDGFLQGEEAIYLRRARQVRAQEKLLRGER